MCTNQRGRRQQKQAERPDTHRFMTNACQDMECVCALQRHSLLFHAATSRSRGGMKTRRRWGWQVKARRQPYISQDCWLLNHRLALTARQVMHQFLSGADRSFQTKIYTAAPVFNPTQVWKETFSSFTSFFPSNVHTCGRCTCVWVHLCVHIDARLHGTTQGIGSALLYPYDQHHDSFIEHCTSGNMMFIVLFRGEEPAMLHTISSDQHH